MPNKKYYPPKITQPLSRKTLPRERLFTQLDDACEHSTLVWLSAPGGSGKTTLVSSYLVARNKKSIWYQMDEGDATAATFFHYFGLAGQKAAPSRKTLLPSLTPEYLQGLSVFARRFFESIASMLGEGGVIVLDNYQLIDEDSEVAKLLSLMAETVAGQLTIIVISRNTTPSILVSLKAKNQLIELDVNSIRFEEDEWLAASKTNGMKLDTEHLHSLHKKMDGWIAGLLLCPDKEFDLKNDDESNGLVNESLFNYFSQEFFHRLDNQSQQLLVHCAFLQHFDGKMAQMVSSVDEAAEILQALYNRNYFIQRQGLSFYTLHPLFQSYLQNEAQQILEKPALDRLMKVSADALVVQGDYEAAAELYIQLQAWSLLIELVVSKAEKLYQQGRFQTLAAWLQVLPEAEIAQNTWVQYWQAALYGYTDIAECLNRLEPVFEQFLNSGDEMGSWASWLLAMQLMTTTWMETARLTSWLNKYDQCHRVFDNTQEFSLQAKLVANLAMGYLLAGTDAEKTAYWFSKLELMIDDCNNQQIKIVLINCALFICIVQGFINKAKQYLIVLDSLEEVASVDPMLQLNVYVNRMFGETFVGDPRRCLELYAEGQQLANHYGIYLFEGMFQIAAITSTLTMGEIKQARTHLQAMEKVKEFPVVNGVNYYWGEAQLMLVEERYQDAIKAAETAYNLVSEIASIPAYALIIKLSLIEAYWASGDRETARRLLEDAINDAAILQMPFMDIRLHLLQADFSMDDGDDVEAIQHIREMFPIAKQFGMHLFSGWLPGRLISRACHWALENNIETTYVKDYVRTLIQWLPVPDSADENWPWPVRIYTLGTFRIELDDGSSLDENKYSSPHMQLLTQLIIRSGSMDIRDIVETLYQDLAVEKRLPQLRKHLHRLRQLLGSDESILRQGDTLSINNRYCWLDIDAFNTLLKQQGLDAEQRAQALYHGEFMPQESNNDFGVLTIREQIRSAYLRMVVMHLDHLDDEAAINHCHKALNIEPLSELLYQKLMRFYRQSGRDDLVLATYEQCRRILHSELGIEPMTESRRIAGVLN